jgi:hypothetical protein
MTVIDRSQQCPSNVLGTRCNSTLYAVVHGLLLSVCVCVCVFDMLFQSGFANN